MKLSSLRTNALSQHYTQNEPVTIVDLTGEPFFCLVANMYLSSLFRVSSRAHK